MLRWPVHPQVPRPAHNRADAPCYVPCCEPQALSEASDLEALRQEKRAIQLEEKRLKALLDLEKAGQHRKADLLVRAVRCEGALLLCRMQKRAHCSSPRVQAAQRAERHRKSAKSQFYREQVRGGPRACLRLCSLSVDSLPDCESCGDGVTVPASAQGA